MSKKLLYSALIISSILSYSDASAASGTKSYDAYCQEYINNLEGAIKSAKTIKLDRGQTYTIKNSEQALSAMKAWLKAIKSSLALHTEAGNQKAYEALGKCYALYEGRYKEHGRVFNFSTDSKASATEGEELEKEEMPAEETE